MRHVKKDKTDKKMAQEFRELMQKRGITDEEKYLVYLIAQKIQKRDASRARMNEAEREIYVCDRMLEGVI